MLFRGGWLEASMKFTPPSFRAWLLVVWLACPLLAVAGDVHYNQMDIQRDGRDKLVLSMSLNLTLVLHQVLAPQTPLVDFLKLHSELSDKALQTAINKTGAQLGDKSSMLLPSGRKVSIRQWQFPTVQALRETLKAHLFLIEISTNTPVHVPPMRVQAMVHSPSPWSRAQLQVHKALHPLWVIHQQDQFWLTEQIPLAIVNFE
jgi:hypothetical protein